jgi:ABC-2 type transport system permease protein
MSKTLLILKHEIVTILSRPSFLIAVIGIPFVATVIFFVVGQVNKGAPGENPLARLISSAPSVQAEGYIDPGGLIKEIPPAVKHGTLLAFRDEASAQQALKQGKIAGYYIIHSDYVTSGKITYVRADYNPLGGTSQEHLLEWVLNVNLLGGDTQLASLVDSPAKVQDVPLSATPQREESNALTFFLPYAVTMMFYFIILSSASLLLTSVAREKENRVMEILMMSATPRQLLTGKIIGLGLVGLLQTVLWVGTGRFLLAKGVSTFNLSSAFQLPASFLVWALVFFLFGYAVYASLMAGLGALVPNLREASQATIVVVFPLIIPIFLINVLIQEPQSPVSLFLSLFPLTSPVSMMSRLASGGVPLWQTVLSALLLAGTAVLVIRAVAGMFRAQSLLSGQPFNRRLFFNALLGKS